MKLDHVKVRDLLKGTPMESLSNSQINNAIIGSYPLTISSKSMKSLWEACVSSKSYELEYLRWLEIDSLLSAMTMKTLKAKNFEQHEMIEKIRRYAKKNLDSKLVLKSQEKIIRSQEEELLRYEIEVRQLNDKCDRMMKDKLI